MKQRAYNLMKRWCDKLLTYEIRLPDPNVDSGLICPACHVIHGRFADLVYPLARRSGRRPETTGIFPPRSGT